MKNRKGKSNDKNVNNDIDDNKDDNELDNNKDNKDIKDIKYRPDGSIDVDSLLKEAGEDDKYIENNFSVTYILSVTIMFIAILFGALIVYHSFDETSIEGIDGSLIKPCVNGICLATDLHIHGDKNCPVIFPNTILFPTIINTKSNKIVNILKGQSNSKYGFAVVPFPEWTDATPNRTILVNGLNEFQYLEGYEVKLRATIQKNRQYIKRRSGKQVIYGKYFYQSDAGKILSHSGTETEKMLLKVATYPNSKSPYPPAEISWITILRNPISRLYDFYLKRPNIKNLPSFSECVMDPNCANEHNFTHWCNLQTTALCGYDPICKKYPHSLSAIEQAKTNLENSFQFVGISEKMEETLKILSFQYPSFFENATLPYEKSNEENEIKLDDTIISQLLSDYCESDNEIYNFAKNLFNKKLNYCSAFININ